MTLQSPFYQLDIASVILTILLFIIFLVRKSYPTLSRRLFKILIAFCGFSSTMEILVVSFGKGTIQLPDIWREIVLITYYAIHLTLHYIFLFYVTSSIRGYLAKKSEKIVFSIIFCSLVIFLMTNPFHHLVFNFDGNGKFAFGFGITLLEGCSALSLVYSFILIIKNRHNYTKIHYTMWLFFIIVWIAAIITEAFVLSLYIENFIITISVLLCTIVADQPEKYFYGETGVYNDETFNIVYGEKFKNNVPFKLVCFNFSDFDLYIQKVGSKRAKVAIIETLKNCRKRFGTQNLFSLKRNIIAIDARILPENVEGICADIAENCYKSGLEFNPDLKLNAQFAVFNCPEDCENLEDLHTAINMSLFNPDIKKDNLVQYFDKKLLSSRHRRASIVMRLHDAIENDGFEMFFQPLYDWKKDKYTALEALIRLKDNGDEFISPAEFIPIAEEDGLIFDIDEIVFEKVCRFIRNNDIKKLGVEFVDINLSLLKLLDSSTVDRYFELASRYEINPSFINLEITETAEGDEKYLSVVRNNIARFKEKGFNFSLDDYGSGYSTVVYMAEMDAKIVKIDASILWNAMKNKKYYTVLENCVRLIYCFDKDCVCEGVETEDMAKMLQRLGVNYFQGYLYSKPINEEQILELLRNKNKVSTVTNKNLRK